MFDMQKKLFISDFVVWYNMKSVSGIVPEGTIPVHVIQLFLNF